MNLVRFLMGLIIVAGSGVLGAWAGELTQAAPPAVPTVVLGPAASASRPPLAISVRPAVGFDSQQSPQVLGGSLSSRQSYEIVCLDVSYKARSRNTVNVELPYVRRYQSLAFADQTLSASGSGIGDIGVGLEHVFREESKFGWQGSCITSLHLPTGRSIYEVPENELPTGIGHYEVRMALGFRRIADPMFAQMSMGLSYTLPRAHNGERISPGLGFTIGSGIGYAPSDRLVLIEQLEYTRRPDIFLESAVSTQVSVVDQAYATHGLYYTPSREGDTYSLRLSLGLNSSSTDCVLSVAVDR